MNDHKDALSMQGKPLPTERQDDEALLREARERAGEAQTWWNENHERADKSVRFAEGEQWNADELAERVGRPNLTVNTLPTFIEQVSGNQRQSRPAIKVIPGDDHGAAMTFEAGEKRKRKIAGADLYSGIIRAIEQNSGAEAHYDKAFDHALDGGFGWLRVLTRYANSRDFDQELLIRSVRNRWAVLTDPLAQEPDRHDMAYAFIGDEMRRAEFTRRYPNARVGDVIDGIDRDRAAYWMHDDVVRVAEYMTREAQPRNLLLFSNGQMAYEDEVKALIQPMYEQGITVTRERKVVTWCAYWRKITAWDVLEGPIKLPFTTIPLVPVIGRERDYRDGTVKLSSLIHHSMDVKRMENFWLSAATERVGASPKAPWIVTKEAIEGYESYWENANRGNPAYLPYNGEAPAPVRQDGSAMPVAEIQMATLMSDRVKSTIGIFNPSLGEEASEKSGRAIALRQRQADNGTFAFTDNLSRALRRVGLLLIEAIPRIYDTERVMRLRNEDGTSDWVKVNQVVPVLDAGGQPVLGVDGKPEEQVINGLGQGEFDVVVSAGPSFATQRQEAAEGQMQLMKIAPSLVPLAGDVMVENMDWPQSDKIARRMRLALDPKLLTPQEREDMAEDQGGEVDPNTGQPAQGQPTPEQQAQQQAAAMQQEAMGMQRQALAADTQAKVAKAEAEIETANATKAKAKADMMEAEVRMQALRMQPPSLPPVLPAAPNHNPGQEIQGA